MAFPHPLRAVPQVLCLGLSLFFAACSGSGGGGAGRSSEGRLLEVLFPDPSHQNDEAENEPPTRASLIQQVVFVFDTPPPASSVGRHTLRIEDALGSPVAGIFELEKKRVVFTPELPTRAAVLQPTGIWDIGGAALEPGAAYTVRTGPRTWNFLIEVDEGLRVRHPDPSREGDVLLTFRTTTDPDLFFTGLPARAPNLASSVPEDGGDEVSPHLFSDPSGVFPPSEPIVLTFDGPLHPDLLNVGDEAFSLVDLDASSLALALEVRLVENRRDRATVEIVPHGILPFGHLLSLELPRDLQGLSQGADPGPGRRVGLTFTSARVPVSLDTVRDELREDFSSNDRQDPDESVITLGVLPATWNEDESGLLQASAPSVGNGLLGPFVPVAPADGSLRSIFLDTNTMEFPMADGSTPDAPAVRVNGGEFSFTDIDIPAGIVVEPIGTRPLVLNATGTVRIAGTIRADASIGAAEQNFDSATHSLPGGQGFAGGGRGGEGHPIHFRSPTQVTYFDLVSPPGGGRGFGSGNQERTGGYGGQSGHRDRKDSNGERGTDSEIDCNEVSSGIPHNNGAKPPGGGGGTFLTSGGSTIAPKNPNATKVFGVGNVIADGFGNFLLFEVKRLRPGLPGPMPFLDADPNNDFIGIRGELQDIIAGQGGGGGGSMLDSYFCGSWCQNDLDPANDAVCQSIEFPGFSSGAVGDARGAGGGGGGGAVLIQAIGPVTILRGGRISCRGAQGGGGEQRDCGNWSGAGGAGSGGAIVLRSSTSVEIKRGAKLDVLGGPWKRAGSNTGALGNCVLNHNPDNDQFVPGDGGRGGDGLIQLQVPVGNVALVANTNSLVPASSWVDPLNLRNPSEFVSLSMAVSDWFDLGRTIARPPSGTNPQYRFFLNGRAVQPADSGLVGTDTDGFVLDPQNTDIRCGFLGTIDPLTQRYTELPREDFIPSSASIQVEFQGAQAMAPGSREIDPASVSGWSPSPGVANGMQFLRYRVTFDVAADGQPLAILPRRPIVQDIKIRAEF